MGIFLKGNLSVLEDLDKSILELVEEGNIDKEIEECEGIKDEIHLDLLKLDSLLMESKTPSQPSQPSPVSKSPQGTGSTSHSTYFRHYKSTLVCVHSAEKYSSAANYQSTDIGDNKIWMIQSRDLVQLCVQGVTSETNLYILRVDTHDQSMDESSENRALERKLLGFWDLEAIGISPEEKSVYERFNEDITFKDGQYEVKRPWKECHATLPDHYTRCQRRLKSLTRRLQSEEITQEYA